MTTPLKQPRFYLSLDQVRDSRLLSAERMTAVEAEIERRISTPRDEQGRPIESARLADLSPWPRMLYPRMDHDQNWLYIRREILAIVLTEEEREMLDKHAFDAATARKEREAFEKATKIPAADWKGWVFDGDRYHASYEDYADHCADMVGDEEMGFNDHTQILWAAQAEQVITDRDVADVFECQMSDRGWDDMETSDLNGVEELQAALDAFVKANETVVSYHPDYTKAIIVPDSLTRRLADIECNVSGIHPILQR